MLLLLFEFLMTPDEIYLTPLDPLTLYVVSRMIPTSVSHQDMDYRSLDVFVEDGELFFSEFGEIYYGGEDCFDSLGFWLY